MAPSRCIELLVTICAVFYSAVGLNRVDANKAEVEAALALDWAAVALG